MSDSSQETAPKKGVRWWPASLILFLAAGVIVWIRLRPDRSFQERNIASLSVLIITCALLFLWWLMLSRTGWRLRLGVAALVLGGLALTVAMVHIRGR